MPDTGFAAGLVEHTFGLKQLFPVFALTGLKFVFPALVAFEMPVTIKELNTLTLIYDAYYDFGLIGVFLFGLILGAVCAALTQKSEKAVIRFCICFTRSLRYILTLHFFSSWFTVPTTWFWFTLTGALYLYVKK